MNLVKRKLCVITIVIVLTSILGILAILEVKRGVSLHESNIQHLALTSQLKDAVYEFDKNPEYAVSHIRDLMKDIRIEPQKCLDSMNAITTYGLKLLGTDRIIDICRADLLLLDKGVVLLDDYQSNKLTASQFKAQFYSITESLHKHSLDFRPLVSKTVGVLLLFAGLFIALKSLLTTGVTIHASKSILQQFKEAIRMEKEIRFKNDALTESIAELEIQKLEILKAHRLAEHRAMHDVLTGLHNRRYLDKFLEKKLTELNKITIFHVDMDGFKHINDTKGHHAGDVVLQAVAERLSSLASENDAVARIGGDEFILANVRGSDDQCFYAEQRASDIVNILNKPVMYNGSECKVSASVGVAVHGGADESISEDYSTLLKNSDLALYRSKLNGRNGFAFYDAELHKQVIEKKQLSTEILAGLEKKEFIPYFQLQVKAGTLEPVGVEALVRWHHPTKGLLFPDSFLPIAEEMGVLEQIDDQMFDQALACFHSWKDKNINIPRLSLNVSYKRLVDKNLIGYLKTCDFEKGQLSFEILESVLLDSIDDDTKQSIDALKEIGIELELDDFGSGHASMLGLIELKPDRFKIDRQLIRDIESTESQRVLVRSILDIGKTLGLEVIAEGVESIEQADILHSLGCDILQGYCFSKPISNDSFVSLLEQKTWQNAA